MWLKPDSDDFRVYKVEQHLYWSFALDRSHKIIRWHIRTEAYRLFNGHWSTLPSSKPDEIGSWSGGIVYDSVSTMLVAWNGILKSPESFMVLRALE